MRVADPGRPRSRSRGMQVRATVARVASVCWPTAVLRLRAFVAWLCRSTCGEIDLPSASSPAQHTMRRACRSVMWPPARPLNTAACSLSVFPRRVRSSATTDAGIPTERDLLPFPSTWTTFAPTSIHRSLTASATVARVVEQANEPSVATRRGLAVTVRLHSPKAPVRGDGEGRAASAPPCRRPPRSPIFDANEMRLFTAAVPRGPDAARMTSAGLRSAEGLAGAAEELTNVRRIGAPRALEPAGEPEGDGLGVAVRALDAR